MIRGGKTCWKAIEVQGPGAGRVELVELTGAPRLAALYRFQNGERSPEDCFIVIVDGHRCTEVTDPGEVDWETFPVLAALEAVSRDELRRLRHILRADPANLTDDDTMPGDAHTLPPTSSGTWALPAALGETAQPVFGKSVTSRGA